MFQENPPYLVQRCKFREYKDGQKISESFDLDYMGAAEFEFGAIPNTLRLLHKYSQSFEIIQVKDLPPFGATKGVCWYMAPEELVKTEKVKNWLKFLSKEDFNLKECTFFHKNFTGEQLSAYYNHDVWFGVQEKGHHGPDIWPVVFSLKKDTLVAFQKALKNSITFMNSKATAKA